MESDVITKIIESIVQTGGTGAVLAGAVWYLLRLQERKDSAAAKLLENERAEVGARELRLRTQVEADTLWERETLQKLIVQTSTMIQENSAALCAFADAVKTRPCIAHQQHQPTRKEI